MHARLASLSFLLAVSVCAQTPPPQPPSGPGGSDYPHAEVVLKGPYIPLRYGGDQRFGYYLFEPAAPTPPDAPVILFLHGFQAHYPALYGEWIEHLVRRGYTVAWVRWDQGLITTGRFVDQALFGWRAALKRLRFRPLEEHVPPARDENGELRTAMVGHSAGAWMAAALAGRAQYPWTRLPAPEALVAVEPSRPLLLRAEPIELIAPSTKLTVLIGDDDWLVCGDSARELWLRTARIPDAHRDYLVARSDSRGAPALVANHLLPFAPPLPGGADALDFYGTWKISTATFDCAFRAENCPAALGDGAPEQVDTGVWSDGAPVEPLLWLGDPFSYTPACRE